MNKVSKKLIIGAAAIGTLVGGVTLVHEKFTANDLTEMCPISQAYYDLDMNQEAYNHQLNHYKKLLDNGEKYNYEYRSEQCLPLDGYTMNADGTCYIETDPIKVYQNNGEVIYVAPAGYYLKNGKCIKTVNPTYRCEGILVIDQNGDYETLITYDEVQKKLVKI